jgi:hypothetical protein
MTGDFITKLVQGSKFRKFPHEILNLQSKVSFDSRSAPQECVGKQRHISYADVVRHGSLIPNATSNRLKNGADLAAGLKLQPYHFTKSKKTTMT